MATVAMTGADTLKINNQVINSLADGDCIVLTYPNELASVKTGKNGNAIFALNETGNQAELVIRLVRGSTDDKFLLSLMAAQKNDFASFVLMTAELVKRVGLGESVVAGDTYFMSGGVFSKGVEAKTNVEGDTEQSVSIYSFKFANAPRTIE